MPDAEDEEFELNWEKLPANKTVEIHPFVSFITNS
jgi:hypothetical protein